MTTTSTTTTTSMGLRMRMGLGMRMRREEPNHQPQSHPKQNRKPPLQIPQILITPPLTSSFIATNPTELTMKRKPRTKRKRRRRNPFGASLTTTTTSATDQITSDHPERLQNPNRSWNELKGRMGSWMWSLRWTWSWKRKRMYRKRRKGTEKLSPEIHVQPSQSPCPQTQRNPFYQSFRHTPQIQQGLWSLQEVELRQPSRPSLSRRPGRRLSSPASRYYRRKYQRQRRNSSSAIHWLLRVWLRRGR